MMNQPWILASNSPRRKELLGLFKQLFEISPADIDETEFVGEEPADYVRRLARSKAEVVAQHYPDAALIIAADTTVADGSEILGKPVDDEDARRMLVQLRNRRHQVYTAITAVVPSQGLWQHELCSSQVPMRDYRAEEIEDYIASGDPMDKAGAYAIQHRGFHPVECFSGCFASVMGMPLCHLTRAIKKFGLTPEVNIGLACQQHLQYDCPISQKVLAGEDVG